MFAQTLRVCVAVVLATPVVGQSRVAGTPAVEVAFPHYVYPSEIKKVEQIDFPNLRLHATGYEDLIPLKKGIFEREDDDGRLWVKLAWIRSLQPAAVEGGRAIVVFDVVDCGGSCSGERQVQVFGIENGHPVLLQTLSFDVQAPGTGARLSTDGVTLLITARSDDDSPHCCPVSVDLAEYKWDGGVFKLVRSRRKMLKESDRHR